MSISDLEIYRTARLMVRVYGDTAANEAAVHIDAFLHRDDLAGQKVWLGVLNAIEDLTDTTPRF